MQASQFQRVEERATKASEEEKQKWAEEHAHSLQQLFEQWQKPLCINGEEYRKHLREDLFNHCCDDPLLKSLIESIT